MVSELSYLSLSRNVEFLKILGLYPLSPGSSKTKKMFHQIYMHTVLFFVLLYTVQQILKVYEVRDDADKVMATMFLFLTNTDFIYKAVVLWKKSDKINEILQTTKGPIFNQGKEEHRAPLLKTVRQALITVRIFNYMSVFTCFLWSLQPTTQHVQGKAVELPIWLPFDVNSNPQFYFAILYMWLQTSWLALGNTTVDVFIAYLLEQCKTQVSILRLDLENIVVKSEELKKERSVSFADALEIQLKKIFIHHNEVIKMTATIQNVFGNAVFYQFIVGGWILCTAAYRMITVNPASMEFVSMIIYINCILIELFLYCYCGNEITFESNMLTESAYEADWLVLPLKHRRLLVFFMERIKYPIQPMAGFIVPLSNSTFVSIVRSSYTFYAFLKNSEKGSE